MKKERDTIFVGLSGGVDSAVSAALLKQAGHNITGVYIKVWQPDWIKCTWKEERRDAMRVAAHLSIPFVTLDLVSEYKKGVIDYMLSEYASGRTPNPDVMCNREVKFGGFWKWAKANGADFIATGHYAGVIKVEDKSLMYAGRDSNKDQSYFLWTLNQKDLKHIIFPIGNLTKPEVRKLATKFQLPNAVKKDSQGLCFIGKIDFKDFLLHYAATQNGMQGISVGKVIDTNGEVIGHHPGALFFTLGERHGFTITKKSINEVPYYVCAKDMKSNTITVEHRRNPNKKSLTASDANHSIANSMVEVAIQNTNWVGKTPSVGSSYMVRTRYRQPFVRASILDISNASQTATLVLNENTDPITPGQSLVIYSEHANKFQVRECLGGGIICDII